MSESKSANEGGRKVSRRRLWWFVGGGVVLVLVIVLILANSAPARVTGSVAIGPTTTPSATPGPTAGASASPTAAATSSASPTPSVPPVDEPAPPAALPPVPLASSAAPLPGVVFSIGKLEAVAGEARGPGEVGGPALRFSVTVRNDTAEKISLTSTVVNLYGGAELAPAVDLAEPGGVPLPDDVEAGATAAGVFVFTVPDEQRGQVQIAVDYSVGAPIVLFQGPAPK